MKKEIIRLSEKLETEADYNRLCRIAEKEPHLFWETLAKNYLHWDKDFTASYVEEKNTETGIRWFPGGEINITANCLDRHLLDGKSESKALIWESEKGYQRHLTFSELCGDVCQAGNALLNSGITFNDIVAIYMPLIPEAIITILACNRIGAIPCILYSGISGYALGQRLDECNVKLLVAAGGTFHNNNFKDLAANVNTAIENIKRVLPVVIVDRVRPQQTKVKNQISWKNWIAGKKRELPYQQMHSEDNAFIIYTSGTTGKPKLIVHKIGGILTACHLTTLWCFNAKPGDVIWCTADLGWITSMAHVIYGPLSNGVTTVIYEGSFVGPHTPVPWEIIQRNQVTQWKTAPSAIRALKNQQVCIPKNYNMNSLGLVFCSGEPLDHQSWHWIEAQILKFRGFIVDGWGQTETCSTMLCALPGLGMMKPNSVGKPLPGAHLRIVNGEQKQSQVGQSGHLQIVGRWPGLMNTVKKTSPQTPYSTGDLAWKDSDGLYYIVGRNDNILNMSGHRISLAEIEQVIKQNSDLQEVAAVAKNHKIKGQCIAVFVTTNSCTTNNEKLKIDIQKIVADFVGRYAIPTEINVVTELPKTDNGKIARGNLSAMASQMDQLTPISTNIVEGTTIQSQLEQECIINSNIQRSPK